MLPPATLTPSLLGTPARVNPFSLRQDLNGGRCKLLDTPSKSVISLTFTLPALQDPCASPSLLRGMPGARAPPRRCRSLPCTPELSRTVVLPKDKKVQVTETVGTEAMAEGTRGDRDGMRKNISELDKRLLVDSMKETEIKGLLKENGGLEQDSHPFVGLEMVSLERLEEGVEDDEVEQSACLTEPMDCTKSPEPADRALDSKPGRTLLTCTLSSSSSSSLQSNGWRLPISNGPPSLPPLPQLDNNNGTTAVIGQQVQWGVGRFANGYSRALALSSEPSGSSEQEEVISCPGCCLVGFSVPSLCLRGSAAVPQPRRRASLPRHRAFQNLNGTITGSATSPATAAATATKSLLCHSSNGLVGAGPSVMCEPGRPLPEAQT